MENPWKIDPWKIHGKSNGNSMEKSMENQWKIHGKSMGNPWIIKTGKRTCFRGTPWVPMVAHGPPWEIMGSHGSPWVPMGPHGFPWVPMGPVLWVQFFGPSGHKIDTAICYTNWEKLNMAWSSTKIHDVSAYCRASILMSICWRRPSSRLSFQW